MSVSYDDVICRDLVSEPLGGTVCFYQGTILFRSSWVDVAINEWNTTQEELDGQKRPNVFLKSSLVFKSEAQT